MNVNFRRYREVPLAAQCLLSDEMEIEAVCRGDTVARWVIPNTITDQGLGRLLDTTVTNLVSVLFVGRSNDAPDVSDVGMASVGDEGYAVARTRAFNCESGPQDQIHTIRGWTSSSGHPAVDRVFAFTDGGGMAWDTIFHRNLVRDDVIGLSRMWEGMEGGSKFPLREFGLVSSVAILTRSRTCIIGDQEDQHDYQEVTVGTLWNRALFPTPIDLEDLPEDVTFRFHYRLRHHLLVEPLEYEVQGATLQTRVYRPDFSYHSPDSLADFTGGARCYETNVMPDLLGPSATVSGPSGSGHSTFSDGGETGDGGYFKEYEYSFDLTEGNFTTGIGLLKHPSTGGVDDYRFVTVFDTKIPKTNAERLFIQARYEWRRA